MLKDLLQGKPLGHPLHPLITHFPISLLVLSLLFDLASWLLHGGPLAVHAAWITMVFGVVMMFVVAVPGLVDYSDIRRDHPARKIATYHMLLNFWALGFYLLNLVLRYPARGAETTPVLPLLLSFLGMGILTLSGYLGGRLIYDDGIAVGRHRRQTPTPMTTLTVAAANTNDGWVAVAPFSTLGDGQTLRVSFDGQVLTIARDKGALCAFQEFCTHRFGPLSEGALHDGQVECPWHGSCFDIRTGAVMHGPAKVDLKTFDVQNRDGTIALRVPAEKKG